MNVSYNKKQIKTNKNIKLLTRNPAPLLPGCSLSALLRLELAVDSPLLPRWP